MKFFPKKTKYSKLQKECIKYNQNNKLSKILLGDLGIKNLYWCTLDKYTLEFIYKFLSYKIKRLGKIWLKVFPSKVLTKFGTSSRMGKGKGKAESWSINISPGTVLFEVETFNYNKVVHLLTKLLTKLPFKAYLVKFTKKFIFF